MVGLLVASVAMVLNSVGALLTADAARRASRARPIAVQPRYLFALLLDLIAWLFAVVALRHLPVFAVQAVIGGTIAVTAVAGARMTDTHLDGTTRVAVGACVASLALVAASAGGEPAPVEAGAIDVILIGTVLVLGVVVMVLRQYRRAWPLAVVSGLGFGGTALAVRAAHVEVANGFSPMLLLGRSSTYLVVGFWVVGMVGYSAALACGDVGSVIAVFTVTEVVLPGLFGIGLLGDQVRAGWGWPFVVGLAVAVAGVVVLTQRPTPRRRSRAR